MYKDSAFAIGTGVRKLLYPLKINELHGNKNFGLIKYISEAEYLTATSIATLMGASRMKIQKYLGDIWKTRVVKCIEVLANTKPERVFKLWMISTTILPKNAMEACRLAALGAFYGRAKNLLTDFEWGIVRSKDRKALTAEMVYLPSGEKEKTRLVIDAPRRGEKPNADADIFIFPSVEEAMIFTPAGKRYTADIMLLNRNIDFKNLISDPVSR
ncbi:MAG: hypothetical protein M1489_06645 [Firmicutes bacterium]|nr:hypothetical protein [Bacillota bacterium]